MIKRFEDEYPETRLPTSVASPPIPTFPDISSKATVPSDKSSDDGETVLVDAVVSEDEGESVRPMLSRHNSDVSLAARALSQEEGRMHRFGQKIRRDILKPEKDDHEQGTDGTESEAAHVQYLRKMVEEMGSEIPNFETQGTDAVVAELNNEASVLRQRLKDADPEGWEKFVQSQMAAQRNSSIAGISNNSSAIE